MTDSLMIAVHAFVSRMSMSVSVDETLLPNMINIYKNPLLIAVFLPKK